MSFDNKQLKDATDFLWDLYASSLPADEMEPDFSPEFLKKMETLQRKHRVQKVWKTAARFAAILLLALALAGGAILTFSTDARAAFHSWLLEITDTGALYHFFNEPEEKAMEHYRIADISQSYELLQIEYGNSLHSLIYGHNDEVLLTFSYSSMKKGDISRVISDHIEKCTVNGQPAEFYYDDKEGASSALIWQDEATGMLFKLDGFMTMEAMTRLAESVVLDFRALPVYQITNLSEGFAFQREVRVTDSCIKVYKNGEATMCLMYTKAGTNMVLGTNTQHQAQTTVNGMPADYYDDCDGSAADLVWIDEDANLAFCLSAFMDMEEMVEIAESVKQPHS